LAKPVKTTARASAREPLMLAPKLSTAPVTSHDSAQGEPKQAAESLIARASAREPSTRMT
jgi:hypothetical protein